jgi:hypothetical protein
MSLDRDESALALDVDYTTCVVDEMTSNELYCNVATVVPSS